MALTIIRKQKELPFNDQAKIAKVGGQALDLPKDISKFEQPTRPKFGVHDSEMNPEFKNVKQDTGISWTNATWNPMVGCSIHTAGCTNCYAMKQAGVINAKHYEGVVKWKQNGSARDSVWTGKINQSPPHILNKPRSIKEASMIFVNSMSDFFHEGMEYEWQRAAMQVMLDTPRHVYQILTKRPENIMKFVAQWQDDFPPNVWVGATMEREDYTHRIDTIRTVPAYLRFLSIEPLVGPAGTLNLDGIGWVIIGGESGPGSRPMKIEWVRDVIQQCIDQKVPVFFKQYGIPQNNPLYQMGGVKNVNLNDPVGKGGSLVDGKSYKQFPKKHTD